MYKRQGLKKVTHRQTMLSQDKINDEAGLDKFINKQNDKIIVQQKLDGLTVVLTYQNGVLVQSVTRGNGFIEMCIRDRYKATRL